jgi:hypothetical protein
MLKSTFLSEIRDIFGKLVFDMSRTKNYAHDTKYITVMDPLMPRFLNKWFLQNVTTDSWHYS